MCNQIFNKKKYQIAIDGPAGSGKSTVAQIISKKLNFLYIPSGNIYRSIVWYLKENNLFWDLKKIPKIINKLKIKIKSDLIYVNDKEVSKEIKSTEISELTKNISQDENVRKHVDKIIKKSIKRKNAIVDGRDIGTVVLPKAFLKIYLDANNKIRAKRRYEELKKNFSDNIDITYEDILNKLNSRDKEDKERKISPLKKAKDAYYIDGSDLTIDDVVKKIIDYYNHNLEQKC